MAAGAVRALAAVLREYAPICIPGLEEDLAERLDIAASESLCVLAECQKGQEAALNEGALEVIHPRLRVHHIAPPAPLGSYELSWHLCSVAVIAPMVLLMTTMLSLGSSWEVGKENEPLLCLG